MTRPHPLPSAPQPQVLLEVDLRHHRHEYGVWSNMSVRVDGYGSSPNCTGMDACAADSATFEHGAPAVLSVWHGSKILTSQLPLYAYAPDVTWQFALGETALPPSAAVRPHAHASLSSYAHHAHTTHVPCT